MYDKAEALGSEGYDRTISDSLDSDRWYNVHDHVYVSSDILIFGMFRIFI